MPTATPQDFIISIKGAPSGTHSKVLAALRQHFAPDDFDYSAAHKAFAFHLRDATTLRGFNQTLGATLKDITIGLALEWTDGVFVAKGSPGFDGTSIGDGLPADAPSTDTAPLTSLAVLTDGEESIPLDAEPEPAPVLSVKPIRAESNKFQIDQIERNPRGVWITLAGENDGTCEVLIQRGTVGHVALLKSPSGLVVLGEGASTSDLADKLRLEFV